MARNRVHDRMRRALTHSVLLVCMITAVAIPGIAPATACDIERCPSTGLDGGDATVGWTEGPAVGGLVTDNKDSIANYAWRVRSLCMLADEAQGTCSPMDFRDCP